MEMIIVLSSISTSLNNIIDSTPEITRKHGVSKTRDIINQLEAGKEKVASDLQKVSDDILEELAYFQKIRKRDLKYVLKSFVEKQIEFHGKVNLIQVL
jgi:cytoplasmic iron level regulating protein YaaA (DUF328/UPF0246 family)